MKLTQKHIEDQVVKKEFSKQGEKTTVCLLTLNNGFEVMGTSACIDPKNYSKAVGEDLAYEKALDKVWELEGYKSQTPQKAKTTIKGNVAVGDIVGHYVAQEGNGLFAPGDLEIMGDVYLGKVPEGVSIALSVETIYAAGNVTFYGGIYF